MCVTRSHLVTSYFVPMGYMNFTEKVVALLLHHGWVCWVSQEKRKYSMSTTMTAASTKRD